MCCIVLAGGAGRRLGGVDKAALDVGGRTLLNRVLGAARPVSDTLVVVGPRRPTSVEGVGFTSEQSPGGGPVPAVAAGLAAAGAACVVMVLAVDLPLLRSADLRRLLSALAESPAGAAGAADHRDRPNPLLAAYEVEGLRARLAELGPDAGCVPAAALLPPGATVVDLGPVATLNVNHPDELERAREYTEEVAIDWPRRYAAALRQAGGAEIDLSDEHVEAVLDLARDVAHATERRWAPVSTWLAGMFVSQRVAGGVPIEEALREAAAVAAELLAAGPAEPHPERSDPPDV